MSILVQENFNTHNMEAAIQTIDIKKIAICLLFIIATMFVYYTLTQGFIHFTTTQTIPQVEVLQWSSDTAWAGGW